MKKNRGPFNCCCFVACFVVAFFVYLPPAFAQSVTPGSGQDIQGAVTNVLGKTGTLVDNLSALCPENSDCAQTPTGKLFRAKVAEIKGNQGRAVGANNRATGDDYNKFNRRKSKNKKDDGCDSTVQICVQDNSSSTVFTSSNNNEPEMDYATGTDVVANLNDVSAAVDALNTELANNVPPPPTITIPALTNADYPFPGAIETNHAVLVAAFGADLVAKKAEELARPVCDQTFVALGEGGNGSLGCLAIVGVYVIVDDVYEALEFRDRGNRYAEIKASYERIGEVYDGLKSMAGGTQYIEQMVYALEKNQLIIVANQAALDANQSYIMLLLTLPEGRRPGFPSGGGGANALPVNTNLNIPTPSAQ